MMRGFSRLVRSPILLVGAVSVGLLVVSASAGAGDCLRPSRPVPAQGATLADLGAAALERLPWDTQIVQANLSRDRPVAVSGCYLMDQDLLVIAQTGLVYPMARRDLTPRWVTALQSALAAVPGEGPAHYVFLVKAPDGAYWIEALSKRSGAKSDRFPVRLSFAASSGVDSDGSRVYVGSLGSPRNNRTVESVSLADGRRGWGWRTHGLLWATPVVSPDGQSLIIAGEDGTVTSLSTGVTEPSEPNWSVHLTGAIDATPAVTPAHVVVGSQDGILRCIDLGSGQVKWLQGLDDPIRTNPWVFGRKQKVKRSSGVEGAPEIEVEVYGGIAFAHNRRGLFAFDLEKGTPLFNDPAGLRPLCWSGRWVVTLDASRTATFWDSQDGYQAKGRLGLQMFDLIPTNPKDGGIFGVTHDGGVVAAVPAP